MVSRYKIFDRYAEEDGQAFPDETCRGMTMFEYFVGQALASFSPGERFAPEPDDAAIWAVRCADAVMREIGEHRLRSLEAAA